MATSFPSPSMYVSACAACLVASLFADSSQSYEPLRLSVWFSRCHTSGQTWSTNCALCEMMTTPPSYSRMASASAPSESRSRKLVGSSRMMMCGSIHMAAASTTLTFWPPESAPILE
mmetsp:Transcript_45802/g.147567  ORF Transcript_45802/g.147567 Transcript_45802/m.147567 type:complete len:117 (-) Transcript_45802:2812-3162(-)